MNKIRTRWLTATLFLFFFSSGMPLAAQDTPKDDPVQARFNKEWEVLDPEMRAAIEKLITVSGAKKQIENMFQAITPQINKMIEQKEKELGKSDPRIRGLAVRHMEHLSDVLVENFDELMRPMMVAYSRHYTLEEIHELIAFYESPVGQKLLQTMPKLIADGMEGMMPVMMKHMDKLNRDLKKEMDALMKEIAAERGYDTQTSTPYSSPETRAVGGVRLLVTCAVLYQTGHPDRGYPGTLSDMGPDGDNCLDEQLSSSVFKGYRFEYQPTDAVGEVNTDFTVVAIPTAYGPGTSRSFFADDSGVIRFTTEDRPAKVTDPPI